MRLQEGRWAEVVVGGGKLASPPGVPRSISAEPLRADPSPAPAGLMHSLRRSPPLPGSGGPLSVCFPSPGSGTTRGQGWPECRCSWLLEPPARPGPVWRCGGPISAVPRGSVGGAPLWWLREAQQQSHVLAPAGPEAGQESLRPVAPLELEETAPAGPQGHAESDQSWVGSRGMRFSAGSGWCKEQAHRPRVPLPSSWWVWWWGPDSSLARYPLVTSGRAFSLLISKVGTIAALFGGALMSVRRHLVLSARPPGRALAEKGEPDALSSLGPAQAPCRAHPPTARPESGAAPEQLVPSLAATRGCPWPGVTGPTPHRPCSPL